MEAYGAHSWVLVPSPCADAYIWLRSYLASWESLAW